MINTNYEFTELYRVYGIERADQIASITEMGKGNKKEIEQMFTVEQIFKKLFNIQ